MLGLLHLGKVISILPGFRKRHDVVANGIDEEPILAGGVRGRLFQRVRGIIVGNRRVIEGDSGAGEHAVGDANPAAADVAEPLVKIQIRAQPFVHDEQQIGQFRVPQRSSADQDVVLIDAAGEDVGAGAADQDVPSRPALEHIDVGVADQEIIANAAGDVLNVADAGSHGCGRT
jgi:hypothetical protein